MEHKPARIERQQHMRVRARGSVVGSGGREIHGRVVGDSEPDLELMLIRVMIVDADLGERTRVAEAFREAGCHVVEAATSLEARDRLRAGKCPMSLIAVADTLPPAAGIELCDYLDGAVRGTLVVGVGDAEWISGRIRIDPSDEDGQLGSRIRSVLREVARL